MIIEAEVRMSDQLTAYDIELIMTSLEFTRTHYENTEYPTPEVKESQLQRVNDVIAKVRVLRDNLREKQDPTS
jgi:hypothetical protein